MYEKKLRVEKLEVVKRLIRKNDYHQYDKTYDECVELGLNVRRPALDKFADKLAILDKQNPPKIEFDKTPEHKVTGSVIYGDEESLGNKDFIQWESTQNDIEPQPIEKSYANYDEMKKRQSEITFELGTLKIKEHELLTELSRLKHNSSH